MCLLWLCVCADNRRPVDRLPKGARRTGGHVGEKSAIRSRLSWRLVDWSHHRVCISLFLLLRLHDDDVPHRRVGVLHQLGVVFAPAIASACFAIFWFFPALSRPRHLPDRALRTLAAPATQ